MSGEPTFTAMTTWAPQRSRTSWMGTLSTRPPSTSLRPSRTTGAIAPGTDMLARIAEVRLPSRIGTRSPVPMSVAMSVSGIGSSSMLPLAEVRADELVEEELDLLAGHRALAVAQAVLRHAELEPGIEPVVDLLAAQVHRLAPGAVVEHAGPVRLGDRLLHLGGRHPGHVRAGGERPHARARHAVERDAHFLEDLEDAQVRAAAGAASAEHQADLRARRPRGGLGQGFGHDGKRPGDEGGQGEKETDGIHGDAPDTIEPAFCPIIAADLPPGAALKPSLPAAILLSALAAGAAAQYTPKVPATVDAPAATSCPECGVVRSVKRIETPQRITADGAQSTAGFVASVPLGGGKPVVGSSSDVRRELKPPVVSYEIVVRLDDGRFQVVRQDDAEDLREGDKVRIDRGKVVLRARE